MMTGNQYAGGFAMLITAFCLTVQAVVVRGHYGWKYRPWYNRALMGLVAAILAARAVTVLHGGIVLNPLGILLSSSMAGWQFLELMRLVTESWARKADMLQLGRYVEDNFHAGSQLPFYELFRRRR